VDDLKQFGHPRLPGSIDGPPSQMGQQGCVVIALDDVEQVGAAAPDRPVPRSPGADGLGEFGRDGAMSRLVLVNAVGAQARVQGDSHGVSVLARFGICHTRDKHPIFAE
jgi:hypothetical protein